MPVTRERTILLILEFDGTEFHGWQQQDNARTVQGVLRETLASMVAHDPMLRASSRTDAGVHALGLPVSFRTSSTIPTLGFLRGLNTLLPPDLSVSEAREVGENFDARTAARGKRYQYDIWNAPWRSALRARRSWWLRGRPLHLASMQSAARHLLGEHDFSSFQAADCDAKHPNRRLDRVDVSEPEPHLVRITVEGNAFLKNMVRIIAGTLAEVGRGRRDPEDMGAILAARDRNAAGQTAPPQGLTLLRVFYDASL